MQLTYQDLLNVGDIDKDRAEFVLKAINNHKDSSDYKMAQIAEDYSAHRNTTIVQFQKLLYTVSGKVVPDNFSANYKLASGFFELFTTQQVQYLLGNGSNWNKSETKDKLGTKKKPWDNQLQELAESALIEKVAFGFWNLDHLEIFKFTEFVPLFDEENGALMAGIRFWQLEDSKPLRATLYEIDGYTEFKYKQSEPYIINDKRAYKLILRATEGNEEQIYDGENYPSFPIVPLWGNKHHQSELVGLREQIDCYDLIKSGFANNVDEASYIYWTIQNAGGMDDVDLVKFVEHMKTVKAAVVEDGGARAESHTMDVPFASREALLDRIEKDMYRDYMALDIRNIASGAVTATQIQAAYEPMNSKADKFEYLVLNFVNNILELAEVDDTPTFKRSTIVNQTEETTMVLSAASYLDTETVLKHLPFISNDEIETILNNVTGEESGRFFLADEEGENLDESRNYMQRQGEAERY